MLRPCRVTGCGQQVPSPLGQEALCLDHYIEEASTRLRAALALCHECKPIEQRLLDWLLAGADFAVQALSQGNQGVSSEQRARLLELLLSLSNLHEYLRHHSVQVAHTE